MKTKSEFARPWHVLPAEYLESRQKNYEISPPISQYIEMPDGCKIAVDVYLPKNTSNDGSEERFPTIAIFTPYYRRFKIREGGSGEVSPNSGKFRDFFVPFGYAVVVIDVRGTGASFGTRDSFRSPQERADSSVVAEWIVRQTWSNGIIGSTGISYLGAAADFLASTGHPAVKAIAPLFAVWDTYADNYFPGGIQVKSLTKLYDDLMIGLDHDDREVLQQFAYFKNPDFEGPQPVDDDPDGDLLKDAIHEHLGNFRQSEFITEFKFREEGLVYDPDFSSASFSPYSYSGSVRPDVAVLSVSGWYDGAGYMNGAISRFLSLKDNPRHLLLGPWDHGARIDISPWRKTIEADFCLMGEILRFFDTYLLDMPTGLRDEAPIHFFSIHSEEWHAAESWPPTEASQKLFLAQGNLLSTIPSSQGVDPYKVDFACGTGTKTRYERISGLSVESYYSDWQGRSDQMLNYTSQPLERAADLAGHVVADLWLSSSEPDAAIYLYLSEIEVDGKEHYVTEGLLRALHRKETPAPETYASSWIFRSFSRADARPLIRGEVERIRIPLLGVAWRFSAGSRIRLSIAGADADHCGQVPHGRPPLFKIFHGTDRLSSLELPLLDHGTAA